MTRTILFRVMIAYAMYLNLRDQIEIRHELGRAGLAIQLVLWMLESAQQGGQSGRRSQGSVGAYREGFIAGCIMASSKSLRYWVMSCGVGQRR